MFLKRNISQKRRVLNEEITNNRIGQRKSIVDKVCGGFFSFHYSKIMVLKIKNKPLQAQVKIFVSCLITLGKRSGLFLFSVVWLWYVPYHIRVIKLGYNICTANKAEYITMR